MRSFIISLFILLLSGTSFAQLADDSVINPVTGEIDKIGISYTDGEAQTATGWTKVDSNVYLTNSDDSVGIGTDSPSSKLEVKGGGDTAITINAKSIGQGGIDANTLLLLHADGSNAGVVFTDSSVTNFTVTPNVTTTSSVWKKFGTASALFGVTTSTLSVPDNSMWATSTNNFEFDFWWYPTDVSASAGFFGQIVNGNNYTNGWWNQAASQLRFGAVSGGAFTIFVSCPFSPSINTPYHIVIQRNGTGTNGIQMYINGVSQTITLQAGAWNGSIPDLSAPFKIGNSQNGTAQGYIDEFRFSNIARYTTNFTPLSAEYDSGAANAIPKLQLQGASSDKWDIKSDGTDSDKFKIGNGADKLTIDANGNVGISTTTPMNKLDVNGGMVIGTTYAGAMIAPTNGLLVAGNVGIGTTITRAKLDVDGTAYFKGNVGVATSYPSSTLHVDGSWSCRHRTITTSETLLANDCLVSVTTPSVFIQLPSAVGIKGRMYSIDNASSGKITVNTTSSELIEGELSQVLSQDDTMEVFSNGSHWRWK